MSEYLDDPNIKHLRPAYGVKDTSTADLIKRLGGIAVEADAQARMGAVQSNLENLQSEAAASRVAETTPQEEMAIGSAISEMGKVDAARRSGGMSEAQYRVRSEAIMKRHMAAAPALSSEIRRRASSTLGFDPAGAAMDVLFDEQQLAAQRQTELDNMRRREGSTYGLDPADYGTPEWEERYQRSKNLQQKAFVISQKQTIGTADLQAASESESSDMISRVNQIVQDRFGPNKNWTSLTDMEIASIPQGDRETFLMNLATTQATLASQLQSKYPTASKEQVQALVSGPNMVIQNIIDRFDPAKDADAVKRQSNFLQNSSEVNAMADPNIRAASAIFKLTGVTAPSVSVANILTVAKMGSGETIGGGFTGAPDTGWIPYGEPNEKVNQTVDSAVRLGNEVTKSPDLSDLSPEDKDKVDFFVSSLAKPLESSGITNNHRQKILEVFADPAMVNYLATVPNPEMAQRVASEAQAYALRTSIAASKEIMRSRGSFSVAPTLFREKVTGESLVPVVTDGQLSIRADATVSAGMARKLNEKYSNRINTSVKAISNMMNISREEAFSFLVSTDPEAFSWIGYSEENKRGRGSAVLSAEQLGKKLSEEGASLPSLEGVEDGVYELDDGTQFTVVGGKIQ